MAQVRLNIAPRIIQSVSSIYTDSYRVIMEMIDNSIDDVESPRFYSTGLQQSKTYTNKIEIKIEIIGKSYKEGKIVITDNCRGIDKLSRIIRNIGNSNKRTSSFTNGQFGYGIFSFMAICGKLEILTKHNDNLKPERVIIKSSDFEQDDISKVGFDVQQIDEPFEYSTGTKVTLSDFTSRTWKEFRAGELKVEIEKHFELILSRKNLEILIIE